MFVLVPNKEDIPKFANFSAPSAGPPAKVAPSSPAPSAPKLASPPPAPKASTPAPQRTSSGGRVIASPLAKKLAAERGIPLEDVAGTGPNGRITKADLDSYVPRAKAAPAGVAGAAVAPLGVRPGQPPAGLPNTPYTDVELTNMRKVIAKRLLQSKTELPHFYLTMEVEMDKVLKYVSPLTD